MPSSNLAVIGALPVTLRAVPAALRILLPA